MPDFNMTGWTQADLGDFRLSVCFDGSADEVIRRVLLDHDALFTESGPAEADVIIFGSDEQDYLSKHPLLRDYRAKCICIAETDIPTFRIPALYAANERSLLARSRTATMSYFISERGNPNPEIKRLIGQPTAKQYLYSFMGGTNSWPRRRLFRALRSSADTIIEPTDSYNHWTHNAPDAAAKVARQQRYAQVLSASKYALCPRGCGLSSYRLFEAMSLGVAPVIISDRWQPTTGVDWSFAIFLPEKRIPDIDRIVRDHESEWKDRGRTAASVYQRHFGDNTIGPTLHGQIAALLTAYDPTRESVMQIASRMRSAGLVLQWASYRRLKALVLAGYRLAGSEFPFRLHGSIAVGAPSPNHDALEGTKSD